MVANWLPDFFPLLVASHLIFTPLLKSKWQQLMLREMWWTHRDNIDK
jgi:hypothetical protein